MSIYNLTDEAIQDLNDIYDYIFNRSLDAAGFVDTFEQKCETLATFPEWAKVMRI